MRLTFQTTSINTARKRALPLVILPERRLPPLCLLPGQTPAHEARCLAEGKRLISTPISARMAAAATSWMPGILAEVAWPRQTGRAVDRSPAATARYALPET